MNLSALLLLTLALQSTPADDPCQGKQNCRVTTPKERTRIVELLERVEKALPKPSPKRYRPDKRQTMNARALRAGLANPDLLPPILHTCQSHSSGCFPQLAHLGLAYERPHRPPPTAVEALLGRPPELSMRVMVTAGTLPFCPSRERPLRVLEDSEQVHEALYPSPIGAEYTLVSGLRHCPRPDPDTLVQMTESEDEQGNKRVKVVVDVSSTLPQPIDASPTQTLATDLSFMVSITGPREEVTALVKRLDRKALQRVFTCWGAGRTDAPGQGPGVACR